MRKSGWGVCIYCGRKDTPLTDEHIVPLSLGGKHIIEEASCEACANITKKFEGDVARGMWGDARIAYDAPSRRKSSRPSHVVAVDAEKAQSARVPFTEYPAGFLFYRMFRCGFLEGLPSNLDISSRWQMQIVMDEKKHAVFQEKYGIKPILKFGNYPQSFARLIAKIGYGQTLTKLNLADFDPVCVPYILGQQENVSFIVGGQFDQVAPIEGAGYSLISNGFGDWQRMIIVAEVRLLANCYSPIYHVVTGEVRGSDNVQQVLAKMDAIQMLPLNVSVDFNSPKEVDHWLPVVWPLPAF